MGVMMTPTWTFQPERSNFASWIVRRRCWRSTFWSKPLNQRLRVTPRRSLRPICHPLPRARTSKPPDESTVRTFCSIFVIVRWAVKEITR
jgi:hypothetical protein